MRTHAPGSANDDFPSLREKLAPLLANAQACVPRADIYVSTYGDETRLVVDAYEGRLVACAQAMTRRDASVYMDWVSYACWNVDPKTAAVTRRSDLARSYLGCEHGGCTPGSGNHLASHDGTERIALDDTTQQLTISKRDGTLVRSFPIPRDLALSEASADDLVFVNHTIFAVDAQALFVLDDHGRELRRIARKPDRGLFVRVIDPDHVLIAEAEPLEASVYDLAKRTTRAVQLPGPYATRAVRFGDALYAVDDQRCLVALDPVTYRVRRTAAFSTCR